MDLQIDSERLRRFVVRIRSVRDGVSIGSGVLVAPKTVLTCAHIVGKATRLWIENDALGSESGCEAVPFLQTPPPPLKSDELWPYPDIALLKLKTHAKHPVAPLYSPFLEQVPIPFLNDDRLHAWGYPMRGDKKDPPGSPATFLVEGIEGDGFANLKQGQTQHGLSGSPLVSTKSLLVVGIVTATKAASGDLGGYATKVQDLWSARGLTADEQKILLRLLHSNRQAALGDRVPWAKVFPVPPSLQSARVSWGIFKKTPHARPTQLLKSDFRIVRFLYRNRQIRRAVDWCNSPEAMGILMVPGRSGTGRSRFAIELMDKMRFSGWTVGWLEEGADELLTLSVPRVVAMRVDDLGISPRTIGATVNTLLSNSTPVAPARLVLLVSDEAENDLIADLTSSTSGRVQQAFNECLISDAGLKSWRTAERNRLYDSAVVAFADAWGSTIKVERPDLRGADYQVPEAVLHEALWNAIPDTSVGRAARTPTQRVIQLEQQQWSRSLPGIDRKVISEAVTLTTLAGVRSDVEAGSVLDKIPDLAADPVTKLRIVRWLTDVTEEFRGAGPLASDLLRDALVATTLKDQERAAALIGAVLSNGTNRQAAFTLRNLSRAGASAPRVRALFNAVIRDQFVDLVARASDEESREKDDEPWLSGALVKTVKPRMLRSLVNQSLATAATLPDALVRLSELGRDAGYAKETAVLVETSTKVITGLAKKNPRDATLKVQLSDVLCVGAGLDLDAGRQNLAIFGITASYGALDSALKIDPTLLSTSKLPGVLGEVVRSGVPEPAALESAIPHLISGFNSAGGLPTPDINVLQALLKQSQRHTL